MLPMQPCRVECQGPEGLRMATAPKRSPDDPKSTQAFPTSSGPNARTEPRGRPGRPKPAAGLAPWRRRVSRSSTSSSQTTSLLASGTPLRPPRAGGQGVLGLPPPLTQAVEGYGGVSLVKFGSWTDRLKVLMSILKAPGLRHSIREGRIACAWTPGACHFWGSFCTWSRAPCQFNREALTLWCRRMTFWKRASLTLLTFRDYHGLSQAFLIEVLPLASGLPLGWVGWA